MVVWYLLKSTGHASCHIWLTLVTNSWDIVQRPNKVVWCLLSHHASHASCTLHQTTHTHTHTHIYERQRTHIYERQHTHAHIYMNVNTHTHTYTYIYIYIYIWTSTLTHMNVTTLTPLRVLANTIDLVQLYKSIFIGNLNKYSCNLTKWIISLLRGLTT